LRQCTLREARRFYAEGAPRTRGAATRPRNRRTTLRLCVESEKQQRSRDQCTRSYMYCKRNSDPDVLDCLPLGTKSLERMLGIVLTLVLCQPAADLLRGTHDGSTPDTSFSVVCASIGQAPSVIRAKVDTTSGSCLEVPESGSLHPPTHGSAFVTTSASSRPGLVLGCSPLSSRPPPIA
jgi:hypothetical protein